MNTIAITYHYATGSESKVFQVKNLARAKSVLRNQKKLHKIAITAIYHNSRKSYRLAS
jgi:hypothetical protein